MLEFYWGCTKYIFYDFYESMFHVSYNDMSFIKFLCKDFFHKQILSAILYNTILITDEVTMNVLELNQVADRYIFVGDIHGCYNELVRLLDIVKPTDNDLVFSTGDFIDKGPYPGECIDYWKTKGYYAVLGNHDDRYLRWLNGETVNYSDGFQSTINKLSIDIKYGNYLRELPIIIKINKLKCVLVHAALNVNTNQDFSNTSYTCNDRDIFLRGRYIRHMDGKELYIPLGKEEKQDRLWNELWKGDYSVIFGHTPFAYRESSYSKNTFGIDTGCVYGGYLTALIYSIEKGWYLISVKAQQQYSIKTKREDISYI
jgi:predicted phosphodiesterase